MCLCGISSLFKLLSPSVRQVTHALLTRPPLAQESLGFISRSFDLHVLGTPPAFILSQDRTLILDPCSRREFGCRPAGEAGFGFSRNQTKMPARSAFKWHFLRFHVKRFLSLSSSRSKLKLGFCSVRYFTVVLVEPVAHRESCFRRMVNLLRRFATYRFGVF